MKREIDKPTSNSICIFQQLVNSAKRIMFPLHSGKNVMELPLYFTLGKTFKGCYDDFSSQYLKLLNENNVDSNTIEVVNNLIENIGETIIEYQNGKVYSAYSSFKNAIEPIKEILPIKTLQNGKFYRMRAEEGLIDIKDFYHLPFNKIYLSKSERFSIEGYACLYLGYSKRVCEVEISNGSLAKFVLTKPLHCILDLTLGQGEGKKDIAEIDLVKIYPLIASCYIVPFYSTIQQKECRPKNSFFREEYIIPQLLTLYLKEEELANGIIYYSVKDPNLDPHGIGENDYRNLVLFTNRDNNINEMYDNELINKFDITI